MTDGFGTGRYMMLLEGPWKTAEMAGGYPDFKYGTYEMPAGDGGSISVLGGEDIAMFKTANKEGAWKFMQFMTSEFAEVEMAKCGQIPVNKTALENDAVKNADFAPFLECHSDRQGTSSGSVLVGNRQRTDQRHDINHKGWDGRTKNAGRSGS